MKIVVTGGAGFIGSNLVSHLLNTGHEVSVIDNLSSGFLENISNLDIRFIDLDLTDPKVANHEVFKNVDVIYHLAANVDNRFSWENPYLSLENNPKATLNVALAAKNFDISRIVFSSTGTIYGDHPKQPYLEEYESSMQTTLYGATKYASEGILSVFSEHFEISCEIFRFVGVLGPNSSHGHLFDFLNKLQTNPDKLEVLGNGYQRKSYIYVDDLITAITRQPSSRKFDVTNVGRSDFSTVRDSVKWIKEELNIDFKDTYQDSERGWVGDNPFLQLDVSKLESNGWKPTYTIEQAVKKTVRWLSENKWIFKRNQFD